MNMNLVSYNEKEYQLGKVKFLLFGKLLTISYSHRNSPFDRNITIKKINSDFSIRVVTLFTK